MRTFNSQPTVPSLDDPGRDLAALILIRAVQDATTGRDGVCIRARAFLLGDEAANLFAACDIDPAAAWEALVGRWADG